MKAIFRPKEINPRHLYTNKNSIKFTTGLNKNALSLNAFLSVKNKNTPSELSLVCKLPLHRVYSGSPVEYFYNVSKLLQEHLDPLVWQCTLLVADHVWCRHGV